MILLCSLRQTILTQDQEAKMAQGAIYSFLYQTFEMLKSLHALWFEQDLHLSTSLTFFNSFDPPVFALA